MSNVPLDTMEKYRAAYDAAMKAARRPHPDAKLKADGHCSLCGYNWAEDVEAHGKHLCPPGYYYKTPSVKFPGVDIDKVHRK